MTQEEFKVILASLKSNYKDVNVKTKEQFTFWYEMLKDLDYKALETASRKYMMENTFSPTIADLRKACCSVSSGDKISSTEAIDLIQKAIRNYGTYAYEGAMKFLEKEDKTVYELVKKLGWKNICGADMKYLQTHLNKLYVEYSKVSSSQALLPDSLKSDISKLRGQLQNSMLALQAGE